MPDPLMIAIAAALVGKAAGALASGGKAAVIGLVKLVRERFDDDDEASAALAAASESPDPERLQQLGAQLEKHAEQDPRFAEQLRTLWHQADSEIRADRGGVVNEISGTVTGPAVQARDVSGGITFGPT